jgi:hypothetical protein
MFPSEAGQSTAGPKLSNTPFNVDVTIKKEITCSLNLNS